MQNQKSIKHFRSSQSDRARFDRSLLTTRYGRGWIGGGEGKTRMINLLKFLKRLWPKEKELWTEEKSEAKQCLHCGRLGSGYRISSPGQLAETILILQEMLNDQTLSEVPNLKGMVQKHNKPFGRVSARGKWEDTLIYDFECKHCHDFFHLGVDTYHGGGGRLKRIGPEIQYDRYGNTLA